MLRQLYHDSRGFLARMREELEPPRRVVHALPSEEELFSAIQIPDAEEFNPACQPAAQVSSAEQLIDFYRNRSRPSFFIASDEIDSAITLLQTAHPDWVSNTLMHANRMTAGVVNVYASQARLLSSEDWATAPMGPGNDILYRYRPHRFAFAPRLALAVLYGHQGALSALNKLISDWATSIRPDVTFAKKFRTFKASSHVALYRSIAISWTLAFLHAAEQRNPELELLCLRIILGDAQYIRACLSHTTRNNHLLADGFGLWYLGSLYPEFKDAQTWKSDGIAVFRAELLRQTYPDGTSFEQSVHYQEHACEMGLAYLVLCRRNDWPIEEVLETRIRAMLHFQATLTGADGATFAIGDTTEDPLFPLDSGESWCAPALRALYGELFEGTVAHVDPAIPSLERAFWLSGGRGCFQPRDSNVNEQRFSLFPNGGFAVFTARKGRERLVLRTGPAPETKLVSGHMHFDFLSVFLAVDGKPILVPGGTYTYRATPPGWAWKHGRWRPYFLSGRAANGLILSDSDPLQRPSGDFPGGLNDDIACRVYTSKEKMSDSLTWVSARVVGKGEHAGWVRSILQVRDDYWLILDELPAKTQRAPAWIGFQFPPGALVDATKQQIVHANVHGVQIQLSLSAGLGQPICLTGSSRPAAGWISNRYGELSAAPQLLIPTASTSVVCASVLSTANASTTKDFRVSSDQSTAGITMRVESDNIADHIEVARSPAHVDTIIRWRRTKDGRLASEEFI